MSNKICTLEVNLQVWRKHSPKRWHRAAQQGPSEGGFRFANWSGVGKVDMSCGPCTAQPRTEN